MKALMLSMFVLFSLLTGCVIPQQQALKQSPKTNIEIVREIVHVKETNAYEQVGQYWGERLNTEGKGVDISDSLVNFLLTSEIVEIGNVDLNSNEIIKGSENTYYFGIHSSLKRAFQDGFRAGFKHRNADLVLGPNIEKAASILGEVSAKKFGFKIREYRENKVKLVSSIEQDLTNTINVSKEIFKELIAEGSPADRNKFEKQFLNNYKSFVEEYMRSLDEYSIDPKSSFINLKYKLSGTGAYKDTITDLVELDSRFAVKGAESVWGFIYKKSLAEVGEELGSKFAHNLISREELLDWLRRAILSSRNKQDENLIQAGFVKTYGAGKSGKKVFINLRESLGI